MGKPSPPSPPDPKETAAAQTSTNVSTAIANAILQNPSQSTPYGDLNYTFGGEMDYSGIPQVRTETTPGTSGGATTAPSYGYNREGGGAPEQNGGTDPTTQYFVGDNQFGSLDEANAWRTRQAQGDNFYSWTDPSTGETFEIPRVSVEQTLSPEQQAIFDTDMSAKANLSTLADEQSGRLIDLLGEPFNLDDLPDRATFDPSQTPGMDRIGSGPEGYTRNVQAGDLQSSIGNAGDITRGVSLPQVSAGGGISAGNVSARDVSYDGNVQSSFQMPNMPDAPDLSAAGDINRSFDPGREIQFETGDAGDITRTYGTDFSEDRQRVEDALMQRMQPQLDQRRETLEARLASQGIRIGSEPYQDAMLDYNRATNDAQLGAVLGAGQEQSRLADLEARRAGFENAAQQQAFSQLRSRQDAFNAAQGQEFGQNLTQAQFANQGQQQAAYQRLAEAGFGLDAAALQGNLALGADRNSIQAQGINADNSLQASLANASNDLQASSTNSTNALRAGIANSDNALRAGIANQNAALSQAQFANNAQQQSFNQLLQGADFANQAQAQGFEQDLLNANLNNQSLDQLFSNNLAATSQNNAAAQQDFANYMAGLGQSNADRSAGLEEAFAERNQPINEISALLGGSGVQQPQFTNPNIGGIPTTDYAGIVNQNFAQQQANYNAELGSFNDLWGGIFGLGAGGLSGGYF